VTEETHAAAVIAALNTVLTPRQAYDYDTVQTMPTKPAQYVAISLSRRYGEGGRVGGTKGIDLWRLTTRYVANTVTNARTLRADTVQALEEVRLTVGSSTTTPIQFETAIPIEPDDDWWSGLDSWTYAL
jgi:hypothetical protein